MKQESIKSLESLSLYCHIGGIITIFIGILVVFMNVVNGDFRHIQVGLFIFITGYAFVKISTQLADILVTEKDSY